ncbi:MAG: sugar transferase [Chloroflexi bacterium]|nr:sugar transferase [Chloroflexota bacterium]
MNLVIISRPQISPYRKVYQIAKRLIDVTLCLLFLPVALPLMGICALLIRISSPGPVIFVQERVGKGGRTFRMYKFRTMSHNLDDSFHRFFMRAFVNGQIDSNGGNGANGKNGTNGNMRGAFTRAFALPKPGNNGNGNGKVYKPIQASQVTRIGRILRKTSLDELPQIFNVLKGEMSLVGPRPNVSWEVDEYRPWHYERLEVLPGITGLAQVQGRSGISFDSIVQYDIEYVEQQSLGMDLKVLWWTLSTVLLGTGAE